MVEKFSNLSDFLAREKIQTCFVDTTVLFSVTYPNDQFNDESVEAFDRLAALRIPAFTNVNVRAEFYEAHRRVLIGECLIDFLSDMESNLDKHLVDKLTSHRKYHRQKVKEGKSAKMDLNQIKVFRQLLADGQHDGWETFCRFYLRNKLAPLWEEAQKELNLNFISLRSDSKSSYLDEPPEWEKAVDIMGCYGLASSDAMILNMFLCSKIPVLLTADMEMAACAVKESKGAKQVFIPDSLLT